MIRVFCILLVGVGVGLLVGGCSIAPASPLDPAQVIERVFQHSPQDPQKAAAEMNQLMQSLSASVGRNDRSFEQQRDDRVYLTASAAMKGFGSTMLTIGGLGLALPFIGRCCNSKTPPRSEVS